MERMFGVSLLAVFETCLGAWTGSELYCIAPLGWLALPL